MVVIDDDSHDGKEMIMYASTDLADALAVVREHDPDTHAAMVASDWHVTTDVREFIGWFRDYGSFSAFEVAQLAVSYAMSEGLTISDRNVMRWPATIMNPDGIARDVAGTPGASVPMATADTLVHEYRHTVQPEYLPDSMRERDAFAFARRFASRLPEPYRTAQLRMDDGSQQNDAEHRAA